ncbi:putative membrane protein [Halanaerobacter jeridensis]|uniref:Membrane protein n=1 Tax=Halanaerobacter jeridensis TaxID=706427 RepID=A0A939BR35_9FIRM|nr:putative membrane protein [Halanaerobacter jeridensis]
MMVSIVIYMKYNLKAVKSKERQEKSKERQEKKRVTRKKQ